MQWVEVHSDGTRRERVLAPTKRRGRRPSVKGFHKRVSDAVKSPAARDSVRLMIGGFETSVLAGGAPRIPFSERVDRHHALLRKRMHPWPAEMHLPTGQAALWHADVIACVPRSGREVARQLARLCGMDSRVTVPLGSLADAVSRTDKAGRHIAYTQTGIKVLVESGWLRTETIGPQGNQRTTYFLSPGERRIEWFPQEDGDWLAMN